MEKKTAVGRNGGKKKRNGMKGNRARKSEERGGRKERLTSKTRRYPLTQILHETQHDTADVQLALHAQTSLDLQVRDVDAQHPAAVHFVASVGVHVGRSFLSLLFHRIRRTTESPSKRERGIRRRARTHGLVTCSPRSFPSPRRCSPVQRSAIMTSPRAIRSPLPRAM